MGIIARQSIKGTIATYLGVAVGFLTTFFVLTRFLSAEEIGLARVLIDAATLFIGLAQLGTTSSIIRFFPYFRDNRASCTENSQPTDYHGFFFWSLIVPLVGFAVFSLVFWLCHASLGAWFSEKSPLFMDYYYFVLPLAFFMLYQTVFETCSNVLMRIVVPRAVREILVRVGLLVCYLLYAFRVISMDGFVVAICLNYALAAAVDIVYVFAVGHISLRPDWTFLRNHPEIIRKYLIYTLFLIVSALASVLAPTLSSFFITAKMGLSYTGVFAIATYMAVVVSIPYRSLASIASPQLADALKREDRQETSMLMQQVTNNTLLVGCFIFLCVWVNIDLIFHLLPNGDTYAVAKNVVFILGLSQLILATFSFVLNALNYSRYFAYSLLLSFLLTVLAIVLNNVLIPVWGIEGAAMSNLLSYALYFVLVVLCVCGFSKTSPFCLSQLYTIGAFVAVLAFNGLCLSFLPITNIWLSSLVRSVCGVGGFALVAYRFQFSPQIYALLRSVFISRH